MNRSARTEYRWTKINRAKEEIQRLEKDAELLSKMILTKSEDEVTEALTEMLDDAEYLTWLIRQAKETRKRS